MNLEIIESVPIGGIYAGVALLMMLCCEIGYRIGDRARTRQDKEAPASLGSMVGGLLAMLGFVLALSFSMAASQHDLRKSNVLEEANAIGTAYLRADLLDPRHRGTVQELLREYVDVRLQAVAVLPLDVVVSKSLEIHSRLWAEVVTAAMETPDTNTALAVQSINHVIDLHEKRLTGAVHNRIPVTVWISLFLISAFTMATIGIQVGLTGKRRLIAIIPLVLAFSVLVTLVVDLNRPSSGLITVGQQAMLDVQRGMRASPGHVP